MIKLATTFSGIGAVEQALNKMQIPYEIQFACDNGERELKCSVLEINENVKKMNFQEKKYILIIYMKVLEEKIMFKIHTLQITTLLIIVFFKISDF